MSSCWRIDSISTVISRLGSCLSARSPKRTLSGPALAVQPSSREARDRRDSARPRLPRLRLVPDRSARARRSFDSLVLVYAAGGGHHLITYFQAVVIGLLQGITELFPISSLGHAVILPKLLGWHLSQKQPYFLAFLVATHLATAIVLFLFFLPEWLRILRGLGRSLRDRQISSQYPDARLAWLLVVGTIPAGLLGLLFEHPLPSLFANPKSAAPFLALNGV